MALGRRLKRQGPIWLGLSATLRSVRPYPRLADLSDMVARSAYTELRYSRMLLAGTIAGLVLTYVVPPVAIAVGLRRRHLWTAALGAGAWGTISATYAPMLRFYGLPVRQAPALPAIAALYAGMTLDRARRHYRGGGAAWKGRTGRPEAPPGLHNA